MKAHTAVALLLGVAAAIAATPAAAGLPPRPTVTPQYRADPSTILVQFKNPATSAAAVRSAGDTPLGLIPGAHVQVVKLKPGETAAQKLAQYGARKDVAFAEPNYVLYPTSTTLTPDDPYLSSQWPLANLNATQAWALYADAFSNSGGAKVAVIDTGVYAGHPDLAGKVLVDDGAGCLGSGFICSHSYSSADDYGHGTHVAGIIGATADNDVGLAGLAFSSPIIPVKVCFTSGYGCPVASIASGIAWAVAKGARVINLSLGGPSGGTMCAATTNAIAHGAVVVASAGNSGSKAPSYPAACKGVIGVGANARDDDNAYYSNWGAPNVFVTAPGGGAGFSVVLADPTRPPDDPSANDASTQVLSTVPFRLGDGSAMLYESIQGTSMAAPFVSGLAAMLVTQRPDRTPADVARIIAETADHVGADFGASFGMGAYYGVPYGGDGKPDPFGVCAVGTGVGAACSWHPYWGYGQIDPLAALGGAPPKVASFSPTSGPVGTAVTVKGADLAAASLISFGGADTGALTAGNEDTITVHVPEGATNAPIVVTTGSGTSTSAATFKVTPRVDSFAPMKVATGSALTIHGFNFTGATAVRIGSVAVPAGGFTVTDDRTLDISQVPVAAKSAKVTVVTPAGTGVSAAALVVLVTPKLSSFAPVAAPVGATVTLTGVGLDGVTDVRIGTTPVVAVTVLSPTQIRIAVPAGAHDGAIGVSEDGVTFVSSTAVLKVTPRIDAFDPPAAAPGSSVTIHGYNFLGATTVRFGALAATITPPVTDTEIVAVVPAKAVTGKVSVVTPSGTGTSTLVVVISAPKVTSFTPLSGPVGATVTVTGVGMDQVSSATLGGTDVGPVTHVSSTKLQFTVPAHAQTGPVVVTAGTTPSLPSTSSFKVTPKVTSFTPASGIRGDTVTIDGSSFFAPLTVKIGTVLVTDVTGSDVELTIVVPPTAVSGKLTVTTAAGSYATPTAFSVTLPPTITGFTPKTGTPGTTVTVTGTSLDSVTSVTLGGVDVGAVSHVGTTKLTFAVPSTAATGDVAVTNAAGTATKGSFTVLLAIQSFSPLVGAPGTQVVIHGTGLGQVVLVEFGGAPAEPLWLSDTDVAAQVPLAAVDGPITLVTIDGARSTTTTSFGVARITSFAPTRAVAGSTITVHGVHLDQVTWVTVSGYTPTYAKVDASTLTLTVPGDATDSLIYMSAAGGTVTSSAQLQIVTVSNSAPYAGPAGTEVTLTGAHLGWATGVQFAGSAAASSFTVDSASQIRAIVPAAAMSGVVMVVTPYGQARAPAFTMQPTIAGFSPSHGPPGTVVTVTGTGLRDVTSAAIGWTAVNSSTISAAADGTQLTFTAPWASGAIKLWTSYGYQTSSSSSFTVVAVSGAYSSANNGNVGGRGETVEIQGSGLEGATAVSFNGTPATTFTPSGTGNSISAVVPAGATTGHVSVQTPWGTVISQSIFYVAGITGFDPASGAAGSTMTITGYGLTELTVHHIVFMTQPFQSFLSYAFTVDSATELTVTVPPGSGAGRIQIAFSNGWWITSPGGESFTYTG